MGTQLFNRHTTWTVFCSFLVALGLGACSDVSNAPAPPTPLSPDAKLASLTVTPGTLAPPFSSDVANYTVDVAFNVTSVTVTASPQNTGSTMTVNGQATTSGQSQTITLGAVGSSTPIPIVVTAPNKSQNTYVVTVHRAVNTSLQSLTVSPGTLNPVFAASTTSYSVDVATTVSSVTVNATLQDVTATMSVNGQATISGQSRSIPLGAEGSSTLVTIVIQQSSSQTTYFVTVNRAALGGNNNLQNLTVSSGTLTPAFSASTTSYTDNVASGVGTVTVTAQAQDAGATVSINGQAGTSRSVTLNAAGQSTLVTIVVTAPNLTQKTYLVTVNRDALGGNNNLQSLTVSSGTLTPAFSASTISYTVGVASGVGTVTVTAQAQDAGATVSINGQAGTSRSVTLNAAGQSTLVTIVVTALNLTQKTYTVLVNRDALGGNNNLQSLTVSSGTLTPAFSASTISYTVDVASGVGTVTVTAQAQDAGATVSINNQAGTSRSVSLGVPGSSTLVTIVVTAPNLNQKTYTVLVTRLALAGNNNLSALVVSAGTLVPTFAPATTTYDVAVPNATTTTTITATVADSTATLTINGVGAISGSPSASISLAVGVNSIPVVVTAQNGTPKTYTVNVTRAALGGNNNLSALVVSAGTLVPTFAPATTTYDVAAPNATASTTVTATLEDSTASMTINGAAAISGSPSASIPLASGPNQILIEVTAQNGTPKTYTVNITVP